MIIFVNNTINKIVKRINSNIKKTDNKYDLTKLDTIRILNSVWYGLGYKYLNETLEIKKINKPVIEIIKHKKDKIIFTVIDNKKQIILSGFIKNDISINI